MSAIFLSLSLNSNLSGNLPHEDAYTAVQNGNAYLPEYRFKPNNNNYKTLEEISSNVLTFPQNPFTIDITTIDKALAMINRITQFQLNEDTGTSNDEALVCIEDTAKYTLETQKIY